MRFICFEILATGVLAFECLRNSACIVLVEATFVRFTFFAILGKPLAIDGVCGRVTIAAIETFQKWYWQQPNFTDGRVEPLSKEPNFPRVKPSYSLRIRPADEGAETWERMASWGPCNSPRGANHHVLAFFTPLD